MKRLQPLALSFISAEAYSLRCKPKFDEISQGDHADLLISMRSRPNNEAVDKNDLETEFPFNFNEEGVVLQDRQFEYLTSDDYGEMWIILAVDNFSIANEQGILNPGPEGGRLSPITIIVDAAGTKSKRRYTVVFRQEDNAENKEFCFSVEGAKENVRTISWIYGSYCANWKKKNWEFQTVPPEDLKPLLKAIIRLDEAIHLDLMNYP